MTCYYVFNGDADGLCALQQLRLAERSNGATLVTGVKRDIKLLRRVTARAGDEVTVLDISLASNRDGLTATLDAGASVRYFDHHHAGELPDHANFHAHIDTAADVCTGILVDRYLSGRHLPWAIAAAFGDSLPKVGHAMAQTAGLDASTTARLEKLGIYLNYNAYGETVADLHFDPAVLAQQMLPFADPLEFVASSDTFARLSAGYADDMARARRVEPVRDVVGATVLIMPDAAWARRVIGVYANELTHAKPANAIAILTPNAKGNYTVSVRVPAKSPLRADEFCLKFPTGGGRKGAAGINHLPPTDVDGFVMSFERRFAAR